MARFVDYYSDSEVRNIMESILDKFTDMFRGFDVQRIHFITTKEKKSHRPLKLRTVSYPMEVFIGRPYIVEVFETKWKVLDQKRKNLAVFHIMCSIPDGGFDLESDNYARKLKPEIEMFMLEFAACGGVPNWMENPLAEDPMEKTQKKVKEDALKNAVVVSDEKKEASGKAGETKDGGKQAVGKSAKRIKRVPVTVSDVTSVEMKKKSA